MTAIFPNYIDLIWLNSTQIIDTLYCHFIDLKNQKPRFNWQSIYIDFEKIKNLWESNGINYFSMENGYKIWITGLPIMVNLEERFYHFISREDYSNRHWIDTIRSYDEARAVRMNHIKPAIENHLHTEVTYFRYQAKKKILHIFWAKSRDFVILVREGYKWRWYYYVDTSYYVDRDGSLKLNRMYEQRLK